jgi:DNA modification methylase
MKDLGIQEIWVSVVEPKTNAEKIEIALADNEEMGYYQEDQLAELISEYKNEIKLESFSIHLGDGVNLEDLLNKYQPEEIIEDEAPEVEEEFISEVGAIYQLGNHRLMCGDSTNIEQVELLMNGKKADMLFTDPPYNINYQGVKDKKDKIKNDNLEESAFEEFLLKTLYKCETMYVCCSWQYAHLFKKVMEKLDRKPKAMIVWDKEIPAQNLDKYYKQHELIFYYGKFGGEKTLRGDVWKLKRQRNTVHPTMKPIELIVSALEDNKDKLNIIDLFGGSGSTLIACEQTKRVCFMMELDPRYVDVIRKRYAKFIGKENEWQEVTPRIN